MKSLLRLALLPVVLLAANTARAETTVPFDQVFNLGNDQGIRIELDPTDDVLVFNGGTFILWGRNLEIHAGRIRVNTDTIIQAFPRGSLPDLAADGAPGLAGASGGDGGPGYPGIAAGTVLIRGTSLEGSGRLIILNDGMDGGAGGNGGAGGPGAPGGPGGDTQCQCEASSCGVSSCLGSILPETEAAGIDDPVIAQSLSGYLKLMQDARMLQDGREGHSAPWLRSFLVCTPTTSGSNGEEGIEGGDGGNGGNGGAGGTGGNVAYVPALQSAVDRGQIVASISGGVGGKAGKPGSPGEGGPGGPGGMKGCEQQSRFEIGTKGDAGDAGKPGDAGKDGAPGKVYVIQD
jgi:hypothetical protein